MECTHTVVFHPYLRNVWNSHLASISLSLSFDQCAGNTLDIVVANFNTLCHIGTFKNLPADLSSDCYIIVVGIEQSNCRHVRQTHNHANHQPISLSL